MGTLRVGVVVPDPPFSSMSGDGDAPAGLDIDLMTAIAERLSETVEFVACEGDFDAVLARLGTVYDCVAAGITVTPEREQMAAFVPPYLISGQALAVDTARQPEVRSVDDLEGLTVGVCRGSSAGIVADQLVADGKAGAVRRYDRPGEWVGDCDAFIALSPVLAEVVKPMTTVDVVQQGLSTEHIAIAVAVGDTQLLSRITVAQAELEDDGTLQQIRRRWLGNPYADQSLATH
ncbi:MULTISPECIES: ABC transporter substrate-binding protein [Mycobacteriaceae]|uniref:ABC transporter substrate-binding protein n=1 Tax=Mycobacteriaceae TaxID=1762 RepID=UPI00080168B1|nr:MULTISPECIES: ABC transporter substrate-binding protein [Mycobacteriaceae]MCK0175243.1 ABC transporter substrate-binding protein [Mycolicibacterium sp. F2034L]OBB59771.1 ABC transporter substrate-binding protein [Mycobacterium sp. 852013-51886_SCH5428379]